MLLKLDETFQAALKELTSQPHWMQIHDLVFNINYDTDHELALDITGIDFKKGTLSATISNTRTREKLIEVSDYYARSSKSQNSMFVEVYKTQDGETTLKSTQSTNKDSVFDLLKEELANFLPEEQRASPHSSPRATKT